MISFPIYNFISNPAFDFFCSLGVNTAVILVPVFAVMAVVSRN